MSTLLHAVVSHLDGRKTLGQVADETSRELGRRLEPDDVEFLIDRKLKPAGLVAAEDEQAPRLERRDPMLALRFRARVIPASVVARAADLAAPLFAGPAVVAVLAAVAAFDAWLFFAHGVAQPARQVVLQPHLSLLVLGLLVVSTAFHELGHAAACRYGGARPGPIGVGLYLAWPVFFSDVTDSYRLRRAGRLRTDLGGVYFNLVFSGLVAAAYLLTRFEPLLVVVALEPIEVLHQFFPFVRLDGYYVVTDLIGVPDLFQRIRPTLASMLPNRPLDPLVAGLKPWARAAVAAWVLVTTLSIVGLYVLLVFGLPRLVATARESLVEHAALVGAAYRAGRPEVVALGAVEELLLVLPLLAVALTLARLARHLVVLLWRYSARRPGARAALGMAAAATLGFAGGVLWQANRYQPIQPWERGTLPAAPAVVSSPAEPPVPRTVPARLPASPVPTRIPSPPAAPSAGPAAPAPAGSPSPAGAAPTSSSSPAATPLRSTSPSAAPSAAPRPSPT